MKLLIKNSLKKIRKMIGRFLSVLFIVALGIGFFAGLRETAPDMLSTIDKYYDDTKLMDFKIVSTMGLTDDDVNSLEKLKNVSEVVPTFSIDVLSEGKAIRMHAIEEGVNNVTLISGKMPSNDTECLAEDGKYKIGDKIIVSKDNISDFVKNSEYTVVGTINSSLYVSREKGIADAGNGKLASFVFIPKENFIMDYYTEVYLFAAGASKMQSYSDDYNKKVSKLEDELLELKPIRETKRYEEILEEAMTKINDAEEVLNKERSEALSKLNDSKKFLDENKAKIENGLSSLNAAEFELYQKQKESLEKINNGLKEISNGRNNYNLALKVAGLNEDTLDSKVNALKNQISVLENSLSNLDKSSSEYLDVLNNLNFIKDQYNNLLVLKKTKETLDSKEKELQASKSTLDNEIKSNLNKIYNERNMLNESRKSLKAGYDKYNQGVLELNEKVANAEKEIELSKQKLDEIEKPKWYLLDRSDNTGYMYFYDDSLKVKAIAQVFPLFFIFVAALMCLNTMARMIEEERTEIGIMSSLGYNKFKIIINYIFYVLMATIGGIVLGSLIGYTLIPRVIYSIYNTNYVIPPLITGVNLLPFIIIVVSTITLMILVTVVACFRELKNQPAILLRPKAPRKGKKVFLEYINFIWKRLSFTWKVTVRNMFRYKQRIIMTVIGIAGCTALLLTGLGLRDSIHSLASVQYGEIIKYDSLIILNKEIEKIDFSFESKLKENGVNSYLMVNQEAYTFSENDNIHDAYLIVSSENKIDEYVNLESILSNKKIVLPDDGVVISEKMAKLLNVKIGDTIKIRNNENELFIVKVADITKNYSMHYVYMNKSYYSKVFDKDLKYNMLMVNSSDNNLDSLIDRTNVSTINYTNDNVKTFDDIVSGLNKIIILLVGAASLLAFIVLYNLTTINISERTREIATLKVLGFYNNEVSSYVYRETLMLTLLGTAIGLLLGSGLERFVILTAETDNVMFLTDISVLSYILAFVITIVFSIIIQIFTYKKLKKIDMIESLKSVE